MLKICFLFLLSLVQFVLFAQVPDGYYSSTNGKVGYTLKTALHQIIKDHKSISYNALYEAYRTSDTKSGNVVWDMYSDVPDGTAPYVYYHGSKQCGNYGGEGDCYNREHSFPQSWFNEASPMKTDLFHVLPTDGYVNGKRSSYPFGEVNQISWESLNGSKLGTSTGDYNGVVFEPIDAYKGDFARIYFYMATRYEDKIAGWKNNGSANTVLNGTSTQVYQKWVLDLLMKWHKNDPVSKKELDRNKAVYTYQLNRNPFVDYPDFVDAIWGNGTVVITDSITPPDTITPPDSIIVGAFCENFENIPDASSSYSNCSWTGENGVHWESNYARTDLQLNGRAICLKHTNGVYLQSSLINGTISRLTFSMEQNYSGSGGEVTVWINDVAKAVFPVAGVGEVQHLQVDVNETSKTFFIKITTNGAVRVAIDDVCFDNLVSNHTLVSKVNIEEVEYNQTVKSLVLKSSSIYNAVLHVYSVSGKCILQKKMNTNEYIDLSALPSGVFVYSVSTPTSYLSGKFVILTK